MQEQWILNLIFWITVLELSALAGIFFLVWRNHRTAEESLLDAQHEFDAGFAYLRKKVTAAHMDVAKTDASLPYLQEMEQRLAGHLICIEGKIDSQRGHHAGGDT